MNVSQLNDRFVSISGFMPEAFARLSIRFSMRFLITIPTGFAGMAFSAYELFWTDYTHYPNRFRRK